MKTRAERLQWAIENHGPGGKTVREFQRASRSHVGRVRSSLYAVRAYLAGEREIHDEYLAGAVEVLGPVRLEWLKTGDGPRTTDGSTPAEPKSTAPAPTPPEEPEVPEGEDPWADIRAPVVAAGPEPGSDALQALDPKYPRRGLTVRNWGILYAVVAGRSTEEVAEEVDLSEPRVSAICDEYADLVREAAGVAG